MFLWLAVLTQFSASKPCVNVCTYECVRWCFTNLRSGLHVGIIYECVEWLCLCMRVCARVK